MSLVCFGNGEGTSLDGKKAQTIHPDLSGSDGLDLTKAKVLPENVGTCFMGASKKAPFDIPGEIARSWLSLPNPNGRNNSEVLRPLCNALNIVRRPTDTWIIDFGTDMSEMDAALYEEPFQYVTKTVKPISEKNIDVVVASNWWRHARPRIEMRSALAKLTRFIVTPGVAKHRVFVFMNATVLPDQATLAIARSDYATFGILHSRLHELWSLRMCTWLGKGNDPRYTPTTTFETFPFPSGLSPEDTEKGQPDTPVANAIATAARRLDELRSAWLNPPEWIDWFCTPQEEQGGFPERPVAKPGFEPELKKRTLINLYNQRPTWLIYAHQDLDAAVAMAYGWKNYSAETPDEDILCFLLQRNLTK